MSIFTDPKLGLIPGPFHKKLEEQNRAQNWYDWAGYAAPGVLDSVEFEYFALRNQASLFDISPIITGKTTSENQFLSWPLLLCPL